MNPVPKRRSASGAHPRPNFPAFHEEGFALTLEEAGDPAESFSALRAHSNSGKPLPLWRLACRTDSGVLAGGLALAFPERDDTPSPRHLPHPVLGEWISALRYTGHGWVETGSPVVMAGYSEERVTGALWTGLQRILRRNGIHFLVGVAPSGSMALEIAVQRGARLLEVHADAPSRHFLYVE